MPNSGMDDAELGAMVRSILTQLAYQQLSLIRGNPKVTSGDISIIAPGFVADYTNVQIERDKMTISGVKVNIRIPFIDVKI